METRERKLRSRTIREYLVHWRNLPDEDATWEGEHILQHPTLHLLGENNIWEGRTVMFLPRIISLNLISQFCLLWGP